MAEPGTELPSTAPPPFAARRLLYIGSGSLGVMFLPMWLHWLRLSYPAMEIRAVITRSATRFVTPTAIAMFSGNPPELDAWGDEPESTARHVDLAEWPDAILVHPASFHFVSRLALGVGDTPALLALQCTTAPIALAPAPPPGAVGSAAWRQQMAALAERDNIVVVPPKTGVSMTSGKANASTAASLYEVLPALETLRSRDAS